MALYSIVFLGSTPIGGPLSGWLCEAVDPRAALVMGGVASIAGALLARIAFDRVAEIPSDRQVAPSRSEGEAVAT
jgi:hypothetical protein